MLTKKQLSKVLLVMLSLLLALSLTGCTYKGDLSKLEKASKAVDNRGIELGYQNYDTFTTNEEGAYINVGSTNNFLFYYVYNESKYEDMSPAECAQYEYEREVGDKKDYDNYKSGENFTRYTVFGFGHYGVYYGVKGNTVLKAIYPPDSSSKEYQVTFDIIKELGFDY